MRRLAVVAGLVACAALVLAPPGPAGADVTVTTRTITVFAPGAEAVISRDPFRLEIQQSDGRPALAEVANQRPQPLPIGPLNDPFGSGLNSSTTPTLYAPLSFLVGSETLSQYEGGLWGGNLMAGARSGVLYSARRVVGATRVRGGVRLTVSTDDPSGRRALVTVGSLSRGAIEVTATASPSQGWQKSGTRSRRRAMRASSASADGTTRSTSTARRSAAGCRRRTSPTTRVI